MKRLLIVSGALIVLILALLGISIAQRYAAYQTALTEYGGVKIGASREEVRYRLGEPDEVYGPVHKAEPGMPYDWGTYQPIYFPDPANDDSEGKVNKLPEGKSINDFDDWAFVAHKPDGGLLMRGGSFETTFKGNRVVEARCVEFNVGGYCKPAFGVGIGATEETVKRKLGEPASESISRDSGVKSMKYDDLGLELSLLKAKVYTIRIKGAAAGFKGRLLKAATL